MRNFWNNLNERERWMVGIGSLFVLFYLFYLLLYSPLTTAVSNKTAQLSEKQQTLTWMQQVRQQSKKQKVQQSISNAKLLTLIGNQLGTGSLRFFPYQLQQTGAGDIQLSYELVPFNHFLSWLWTLSNHYGIVLKQFSAERTPTTGVVKLQIVITAK